MDIEEAEKKTRGPGEKTAAALVSVAWRAIFARDYPKSLAASDRSLMLRPGDLMTETNRAHALMFLGRVNDARALYIAHKGKPIASQDSRTWEAVISEDFAEFRKAGLTHPAMIEIEKALGVTR